MKRIADVAHLFGCLVYGQISNGGLKGVDNLLDINNAEESALESVVCEFAEVALRLKKARFDGVQLQSCSWIFICECFG